MIFVSLVAYWTLLKYGYFTMLKPSPVKSTELLRMRCWHGSARIQKRTHPAEETGPKPGNLQMCLDIHMFFL